MPAATVEDSKVKSTSTRVAPLAFADEHEARLIAAVKALRPLLMSEAPAGEAERSMTATVFAAVTDLKLWWMITPRRWGGLGMSSSAMGRVNREVAKGDPAVAWVLQIVNGCNWIASLTTDRLQREIFGDGPVRVCSSFATAGAAKPVAGGFIVDGEWPYNSGSRQSQWGQYLVTVQNADGSAMPGCFAYIQMKDVEIIDTWFSAGMQGTSSDSARVTNLFVPEHRIVFSNRPFGYDRDSKELVGEASDFWPVIPLIRSVGLNLSIGAAEAALELALDGAHKRSVATTTYARQAQAPVIQRNLGEAAAKIESAKLLVEDTTGLYDRMALAGIDPDQASRARTKGESALIVKQLLESLDLIMSSAGSSAFLLSNPLQRYWRDVNVAARHAINAPDVGFEIFGRAILGVEPNIMIPSQI